MIYALGMTPAIIIDLDNTLCDNAHRSHLYNTDLDAYYSLIGKDKINKWCKATIECFAKQDYVPLFITGRPSRYRSVTMQWLCDHLALEPNHVHLFTNGDNTHDYASVKKHLYKTQIQNHYDVLFAIEDNPSCVKMWRSLGLTCLDCGTSYCFSL